MSSRMNNNMCSPNSIDQLPDQLLISIVSCLPMKDAARTSILSHRWRYVWAFTCVLDFDSSLVNSRFKGSATTFGSESWIRFVNWVDTVLEVHYGTTIDEFRISCNLDLASSDYIHRWLKFAFMKSAKRLKFNLAHVYGYTSDYDNYYKFPNICDPIERLCIFPIGLTCGSLETLRLSKVSITAEVLEFLISKCPSLEELYLVHSPHITSLIISFPLMRLRRLRLNGCPLLRILKVCSPSSLSHLEIYSCICLSTVEICSPNLLSHFDTHNCRDLSSLQLSSPCLHSFILLDCKPTMALKNVSSLINLSLGADKPNTLIYNFAQVSGCLSRLETLRIRLFSLEVHHPLPKFPNLPNLKKLVLCVSVYGCESLLCFASLIDAAPMLREIVLKLNLELRGDSRIPRMRGTIVPTKGQRHEGIEVLQIIGFCGLKSDVELAGYVMEHAVSLKKVIINYGPPVETYDDDVIIDKLDKLAREGVGLIQANLPQGVQLIVTRLIDDLLK